MRLTPLIWALILYPDQDAEKVQMCDRRIKAQAKLLQAKSSVSLDLERSLLIRIIQEHFCCTCRSAGTTSLRSADSRFGSSTYRWGQAPFFLAPVHVREATEQEPPWTGGASVLGPHAVLAPRLSDFATNRHESCGLNDSARHAHADQKHGQQDQ